ncbi:MAG: S-layer protein, partial [Planctomycetaceae bacterium]
MKFAQYSTALITFFAALYLSGSFAVAADARIELSPLGAGDTIAIRSRDARQQLIVTAVAEDGKQADVTRDAAWVVSDPAVLMVDSTGMAVPSADGDITVTATYGDKTATAHVTVSGFAQPMPINFRNQIVPIFTKLGCNGGGCHGKSGGQNGFKLSLLGFYPEDDFEFLRKESRGRRIFPAIPGESLLIRKAVGRSPHGGGKRMETGNYEYNLLVQWIEQGMPYGADTDPSVTGIRCVPETRTMKQKSQQQIAVIATYSDGTTEDVTRMALFEPNEAEMAECSSTGLVSTLDLAGEVAIMARYQGQVATFRATVPLGADTSNMPEPINLVDTAVFGKLKQL